MGKASFLATWFGLHRLAALRLVLVFHGHAMSRRMYDFVDSQQPFLLGVASATLILFFISGEASRGVARWRELKKERS